MREPQQQAAPQPKLRLTSKFTFLQSALVPEQSHSHDGQALLLLELQWQTRRPCTRSSGPVLQRMAVRLPSRGARSNGYAQSTPTDHATCLPACTRGTNETRVFADRSRVANMLSKPWPFQGTAHSMRCGQHHHLLDRLLNSSSAYAAALRRLHPQPFLMHVQMNEDFLLVRKALNKLPMENSSAIGYEKGLQRDKTLDGKVFPFFPFFSLCNTRQDAPWGCYIRSMYKMRAKQLPEAVSIGLRIGLSLCNKESSMHASAAASLISAFHLFCF